MSRECEMCGDHTLESKCAKNAGEMAIKIYEAIYNSDPEIMKNAPDALIRVFVNLAYKNGWSLEKMQNETALAIKYYYTHEEIYNRDDKD